MKKNIKNAFITCVVFVCIVVCIGGFVSRYKHSLVSVNNVYIFDGIKYYDEFSEKEKTNKNCDDDTSKDTYLNTIFDNVLSIPCYYVMNEIEKLKKDNDEED